MPSVVIEAPESTVDALDDEFGAYHRLDGFILLDEEFGEVFWFVDENDLPTDAWRIDMTTELPSQ